MKFVPSGVRFGSYFVFVIPRTIASLWGYRRRGVEVRKVVVSTPRWS